MRCLGDAFWTFPFLGTLWCAPLVLCLVYMRVSNPLLSYQGAGTVT